MIIKPYAWWVHLFAQSQMACGSMMAATLLLPPENYYVSNLKSASCLGQCTRWPEGVLSGVDVDRGIDYGEVRLAGEDRMLRVSSCMSRSVVINISRFKFVKGNNLDFSWEYNVCDVFVRHRMVYHKELEVVFFYFIIPYKNKWTCREFCTYIWFSLLLSCRSWLNLLLYSF